MAIEITIYWPIVWEVQSDGIGRFLKPKKNLSTDATHKIRLGEMGNYGISLEGAPSIGTMFAKSRSALMGFMNSSGHC